jgi:CPA2 family monovalent cation:H+ antiporter-2
MENLHLVVDLVIALAAAFLGGFIANRLGQPVLLGYIVAGILIGPNTPGLVADRANVETLANLGVAFLMFTIGVELSFAELRRVQRVALATGAIQIPLMVLVGAVAGHMIGWSWQASVLLGLCFALSSTIVAIKLSASRGEMTSPYARTALGIGIVQDLALVPIIALLPILQGSNDDLARTVLQSLGIALLALVVMALIGTRVAPRVFYAVAQTGSRELFLLAIVIMALGTAVAAEEVGLSLALGAFLAGLVISESEFDSQVLTEIVPLRDLFATLFFVSIGMLLDPGFVIDNAWLVVALVITLVLVKALVMGGALLAAGANYRVATRASTLLSQMGEFSFVLAGVAMADAIIDDDQYGLILAVALASIVITPFFTRLDPTLLGIGGRLPGVKRREASLVGQEPSADHSLGNEVVLCGYGRVGMVLGDVLQRYEFRFTVVEMNPVNVRQLRERDIPALYGDAGSEALLERAGILESRVLVVTIPDLVAVLAAIRSARRLNPGIAIIVRADTQHNVEMLMAAGADQVIQPELEAGLRSVEHMLDLLEVPATEASAELVLRRRLLYGDRESW